MRPLGALRLLRRSRVWPKLRFHLPPPLRLVTGLAFLVGLGTLLLLLPGMAVRPLTFREAIFTATSALTVTGLSLIVPVRDLTLPGQIVLLLLIQSGGVGFMVVAVIALRLLRRKVTLPARLALTDSLGLASPREILRLTGRTIGVVFAIEASGAAALWLHWRDLLGDSRAVLYGVFHAVSAFCNAGFDLFSGLPAWSGVPTDPGSLAIMGVLVVVGGLGIPVIGDLILRPGRISLHSKVTLIVAAVLLLGGGLAIFFAESRPGGTLASTAWPEGLGVSLFQSASARTAGFSGLPNFEQLTPATQWLMTLLMFVGSAPASMGGGITTGTLAVLVLALWSYARGHPSVRVGRRTIAEGQVRRASAVLVISGFAIAAVTWLLLITQPATLDDVLFTVVSAFATTGLSLPLTAELDDFGLLLIMLMMFWGRLGALTIIIALARQGPPQPVSYPEEQLLIG